MDGAIGSNRNNIISISKSSKFKYKEESTKSLYK